MDELRHKSDNDEERADAEPIEPPTLPATETEPERHSRGVLETFRAAYRRAKHGQGTGAKKPTADPLVSQRVSQNRDRTKTMFMMVASLVVLLVVFLGLFSSSEGDTKRQQVTRRGNPNLGRPDEQGQTQGKRQGSVTPLLEAEMKGQEGPSDELTPEDINGTARAMSVQGPAGSVQASSGAAPKGRSSSYSDPALEAYRRQVQSSAATSPAAPLPPVHPVATVPANMAAKESESLARASLVFVRDKAETTVTPAANADAKPVADRRRDDRVWSGLPTGTRLLARLQTAVSTAVKAPVVAVIEAHYERDGEIVVPAGTKALGELQSAGRSGMVGIRFHTLQMPEGRAETIDGGAMSLNFGPLKGNVTGANRGKQFLARTLTGVGTIAAFAVGRPGGLSGPVDSSILLRERVAQNIGTAGEQQLSNLAYNQEIVVTVPGNTRFFIVLQQGTGQDIAKLAASSANGGERAEVPTAAELRELAALKQEMNRLYRESTTTGRAPGTSR